MSKESLVLAFPPAAPEESPGLPGGQTEPLCGCPDVAEDLRNGVDGVVVIDTRAEAMYAAGHIPGALSLPHRLMDEAGTAQLDREKCM